MGFKMFSIEKLEEEGRYIISFLGITLKIKFGVNYFIHKVIRLNVPLIKLLDKVIIKDKNKVIFTSYPDFADSSKIFYDYLTTIKQNKFKNLIWIYIKEESDCNSIKDKKYFLYSLKGVYHLLTAKYIIHDHCDKFIALLSSNRRVLFNLWHGMPIKAIGKSDTGLSKQSQKNYKYMSEHSYMFVISDIYRVILSSMLQINPNKIFVTGQARTDVLFNDSQNDKIIKQLDIDASKQIIIYTPTYKKRSKNDDVKTNYDNIFYLKDYSDSDFVKFLEQNNILFIIKPHPYEQEKFKNLMEISTLPKSENIKVLYNDDFLKNNLMLNEIFSFSDLMISDFSSVTIDYSMLNKPILYLNNYINEYKQGRGFILPDNYKIMMPGENINSYDELKSKIIECLNNKKANYSKEEVNLLHKHKDGNSCERIFEIMKGL